MTPRLLDGAIPAIGSAPSSRSRATNGVSVRRATPGAAGSTLTRRNAGTGSDLPLSESGSSSSTSTASRTSRSVSAPMMISPGSAACSSRADVDGIPDRQVLARTHQHGTVLTPVRNRKDTPTSSATAGSRRESRPPAHRPERIILTHPRDPEHRHHRIPDELLNRPAVMLDHPAHHLESRFSTPRNTSGSSCSPSAVEPVTSQNIAVTTFRAWRAGAEPRAQRHTRYRTALPPGSPGRNSRRPPRPEAEDYTEARRHHPDSPVSLVRSVWRRLR